MEVLAIPFAIGGLFFINKIKTTNMYSIEVNVMVYK